MQSRKINPKLGGSKPASQIYFTGFKSHLKKHWYPLLEAYPCKFTNYKKKGTTTAVITSDDFLVTAPTDTLIEEFSTILKKNTQSKISDPLNILRLYYPPKNDGPTHISQPALVSKSLHKSYMHVCNSKPTPLPKNTKFDPSPTSPELPSAHKEVFQSIIGDLRYPADSTRPDISFSSALLARHTAIPQPTT